MSNEYGKLHQQVVDTLTTVADAMSDAWGNHQSFTCSEAEEWIALHRVVGLDELADDLTDAHAATDDDESDEHHARYLELKAGCTGHFQHGSVQHDGNTCPVHEEGDN